jgi:hypothetical protein
MPAVTASAGDGGGTVTALAWDAVLVAVPLLVIAAVAARAVLVTSRAVRGVTGGRLRHPAQSGPCDNCRTPGDVHVNGRWCPPGGAS